MESISKLFFVIIFLCFSVSNAQNIDVEGKVIGKIAMPNLIEGMKRPKSQGTNITG